MAIQGFHCAFNRLPWAVLPLHLNRKLHEN